MRLTKRGWQNADDKMRMTKWGRGVAVVDDEILMKENELSMFSYSFTCETTLEYLGRETSNIIIFFFIKSKNRSGRVMNNFFFI